ncbi:lipid A deacylase LpxR family protein [Dongia rigui]|uniref:Lipid A deacylase LpxR family protein n=1 Tax=Dongia rigui TaxID=940149 RepID=A0ABU5E226_9PROT|nr:lipid A deacylase LpxR family protein [Dongia rigui]MDY0873662.1 lipid A deacylase LpxR family protein [Dongia rigui]
MPHHIRALRRLTPLLLCLLAAPAFADDDGRITLTEENDSIYFDDDQAYTQGFEFVYLGPDVAADSGWAAPFNGLTGIGLFGNGSEVSRRYQVIFGQSIFTPEDTSLEDPEQDDRPYAGWTYGGLSFIQDTDRRRLDHLELLAGIVGPAAQGRPAQNDWHQFIGVDTAEGWDHQLHNEPGIMLTYERKYRFIQPLIGGFAVDAIPEAGVTLGNVMTYGEVGTLLRFGRNLEADYGPNRIRPSLSGTSYFNADYLEDPFGFYFYVGAQGRAVAQNIFLDGNTFRDSRDVDKEIFVGDLTGGVALFWSNSVKLDAGFTYRTQEFEGQDENAKFANINLTVGF